MRHLGHEVTRLIRTGYGPFQLGALAPRAVEEVRPKVLKEQLGCRVRRQPAAPATAQGRGLRCGSSPASIAAAGSRRPRARTRGRRTIAPARRCSASCRMASRELAGARFLDLFAGTGAVGLEAVSRGAAAALLIERDRAGGALRHGQSRRAGRDSARSGSCAATPAGSAAHRSPTTSSSSTRPTAAASSAGAGGRWSPAAGWRPAPGSICELSSGRRRSSRRTGLAIEDERRYGKARFVFLRRLG